MDGNVCAFNGKEVCLESADHWSTQVQLCRKKSLLWDLDSVDHTFALLMRGPASYVSVLTEKLPNISVMFTQALSSVSTLPHHAAVLLSSDLSYVFASADSTLCGFPLNKSLPDIVEHTVGSIVNMVRGPHGHIYATTDAGVLQHYDWNVGRLQNYSLHRGTLNFLRHGLVGRKPIALLRNCGDRLLIGGYEELMLFDPAVQKATSLLANIPTSTQAVCDNSGNLVFGASAGKAWMYDIRSKERTAYSSKRHITDGLCFCDPYLVMQCKGRAEIYAWDTRYDVGCIRLPCTESVDFIGQYEKLVWAGSRNAVQLFYLGQ